MAIYNAIMSKIIEHTGVVLAVDNGRVRVQFSQQSACSGCHARSMCQSTESREREVWAWTGEPMQVGDKVMVQVAERVAWRAIALAYGLPFVLMMTALVVMQQWLSEAVAGTIALVTMAMYYIVLSFFRERLQKSFDFTARKI